MFEGLTCESAGDFLRRHSRFSPALAQRLSILMLLVLAASMTTSCGTVTTAAAHGAQNIALSLAPNDLTLLPNQQQQFTATVSGTSMTGVTWSTTAGLVNANGLYTAPPVTARTIAYLTATSKADSTRFVTVSVVINPSSNQPLQITSGNPAPGQQGDLYSQLFSATGGTTPYRWSISAGTPPAGITMNTSGELYGTTTATGTSSFTVTVTDATGKTATGVFSVSILAGSGFDGPAKLPMATPVRAMADTPTPGTTISVSAGGDLQSALNSANCGDTIRLQAGATFTGIFNFPAKNCDSAHWIIVRTSAADSSLPAEGQRLTPCYAGVASLTGRPQYSCSNPQNVLAKLMVSGSEDVLVSFLSGANHYRLLGLELTRPTRTKGSPTLISVAQGGTAANIVVDRSWLHGTTQDDTWVGINLAGTNNVAVVDSYFSDFHCTSITGMCTDAHAIGGGTGNSQDGVYEIADNFLEASGEAILFGGAEGTTTPTDISIQFNHFFKPWQWMSGNKPFQGGSSGNPFIVKNHLELKNAVRVLAEDNLMEDVWGGFSQTGSAILLNPSNQPSQTKLGLDQCPTCAVTDVTIRYTHIFHAGGGIVMVTAISGHGLAGGGAAALAGERWSIHDLVLDDISQNYVGEGRLFYLANGWPANPVNTVTINHITGFSDVNGGLMFTGNALTNPEMYGFVFTNNLVTVGKYPVWNRGGDDPCASSSLPLTNLSNCFSSYTFNYNALIASPAAFGPSTWPAGNFFGSSANQVGVVAYDNGNGGNYQLQSNSPYKNAGNDGKDLGADIVGLNAALQGVE
jgi:Putative Ig domain